MPKPKRNIKLQTPRGQISTYRTKDGKVIARLDWEPGFKRKRKMDLIMHRNLLTLSV